MKHYDSIPAVVDMMRAADPDQTAKVRFPVQAGMAVRGLMRRELKSYCFVHEIDLNIDEDKGFLESNFNISINGQVRYLVPLMEWFLNLEKQV